VRGADKKINKGAVSVFLGLNFRVALFFLGILIWVLGCSMISFLQRA
jgi:type IV secretory pathway TrbD component